MTAPADGHASHLTLRFGLPGGGRALFTTRADGNLSTMRGPGHEHGWGERDRLCEQLGLRWLCASRQVHGAVVQRITAQEGSGGGAVAIDADGHATALRGVGAMVLVADCLPVVLGTEGAVAALHAGWRGLAGGVLEEGVRALRELGGEGDITAVIGPGAGPCCYEVGAEVHAAFGDRSGAGAEVNAAPGDWSEVGRRPPGRNLDLPGLARERLAAAGVGRIEDVGMCTICDERLFSHRREGLGAGRQAGVAWLS
ncbi:MAG: polyphenol oxidase family protein [Solirubrobacterales bacterium]